MTKKQLPAEVQTLIRNKVFRCSWCANDTHTTNTTHYARHRIPRTLDECPNSGRPIDEFELLAAVRIALSHRQAEMASLLDTIEAAQTALNEHKRIAAKASAWLKRAQKQAAPEVHKWISKIQTAQRKTAAKDSHD